VARYITYSIRYRAALDSNNYGLLQFTRAARGGGAGNTQLASPRARAQLSGLSARMEAGGGRGGGRLDRCGLNCRQETPLAPPPPPRVCFCLFGREMVRVTQVGGGVLAAPLPPPPDMGICRGLRLIQSETQLLGTTCMMEVSGSAPTPNGQHFLRCSSIR
jgi:hypothetical protein